MHTNVYKTVQTVKAMNPLHLGGYDLEILTSNAPPHSELVIHDGNRNNNIPSRYLFLPRQCPHDSIVIENATGHVNLAALRWLSAHNIPVHFLDFDGSVISSILPPTPIKADLRIAQIQVSNNNKQKLTIARAIVDTKIRRSLFVLEWLAARHDIEEELQLTRAEALGLGKADSVSQVRTVEGRVALRYWEAFESNPISRRFVTSRISGCSRRGRYLTLSRILV